MCRNDPHHIIDQAAFRWKRLFLLIAGYIKDKNREKSVMPQLNEKAAQNLSALRAQKPLIHNITNYVVMNYTANALLAMGA